MAARKKSAKSRRPSASKKRGAKKAGKRAGKKAAGRATRPARAKARPKARPKAKRAGARRPVARRASAARRTGSPRRAGGAMRPVRAARPAGSPVNVLDMPALNGKPARSGIGLTHHHADYTSHDVEGVRRFYAEVLGFDNTLYIPEFGYLTVFISPRSSLGFMAPMPGMAPESWSPPGEPNIYLFVEDVDRAYESLMAKGVSFDHAPADMPWGHRLASFRDPEGRRVCLAKNIMK